MPPSSTLATLRPDLGGSFMEFDSAMNREGMIATKVLRVMETKKSSGTFGKVTIASLLRSANTTRAPRSPYNRSLWEFTDASFSTKENGIEEPVDDREDALYRDYFDQELISAERALSTVMGNMEKRAAALMENTATFVDTAVSVAWDVPATATPITDVEGGVQRLWAKGIRANALVLPWAAFRNIRLVAQVTAAIASAGAGDKITAREVTVDRLKTVFDLDHILVGGMIQNTANEGAAGAFSGVWDPDKVHVCKICETNDISEPGVGRTFHWGEDGSDIGGLVESYREEGIRGDVIRARMDTDEQILYPAASEMLTGIET